MKNLALQCLENPQLQFDVTIAATFGQRLVGLLRHRTAPKSGKGLLLRPGGSVHSIGMKETIDVIHLNEHNHVLAHQRLKPWRIKKAPRGTQSTLEIGCYGRAGELCGCHLMEKEKWL